jgi:hypothetical protein
MRVPTEDAAPTQRRRFRAAAVVAALGLLAAVLASAASGGGVTNRVQVGLPGRNDTVGYSPALFVDFTSPPPYASGCCTDPDSGEWTGPPYAAEQKPDLGGTATIDWSATFDRKPRTAIDAIRAHLVHHWPAEAFKPTAVPHVVKTGRGVRRVGTIPAEIGITHEPGSNAAQVEAAVAFPLCKGIFVVARFDLLEPGADDTNGVFGRYLIKGAVPSAWNRAAAIAAMQGVSVDGLLPARTIKLGGSLKAAGSPSVPATVIGSVLDCRGHVMPGVRVRIGGYSGVTNAGGQFHVVVRRAGRYRAIATAAGGTAASGPIAVG